MACPFHTRPWTTGLTSVAIVTTLAITLHMVMQAGGASRADDGIQIERVHLPKQHLTIYSGRAESLVGDLIREFQDHTGIQVRVKYAGTGPLASLVIEEGRRSPADVFFAQDPGGLGVLAEAGRLTELPSQIQQRVAYEHRDPLGRWVGVTGRLRTIAYSTDRITVDQLPASMLDLTDKQWSGRVGWAPGNASFQAFITAMRHQHGEAATERWLVEMLANGTRTFVNNTSILQAIADGEVDLGLANHYYAHRINAERNGAFPVANHVPMGHDGQGDIGGAMLVSGVAILDTCDNRDHAERFVEFLLSDHAQAYFVKQTFEYPLASEQTPAADVPSLNMLPIRNVDLNQLGDLRETVAMLRRVGALR